MTEILKLGKVEASIQWAQTKLEMGELLCFPFLLAPFAPITNNILHFARGGVEEGLKSVS